MRQSDPRINIRHFSLKNYLIIFSLIIFFAGSYAGVYFLQWKSRDELYIALSMVAYLVVISGFATFLFAIIRAQAYDKPISVLQNAIEKVAEGDYSVRLSPLRKDGKVDEIEAMIMDFNYMVEELESVEMLKNDFVSNVSHELKTPLSVIKSSTDLILGDSLSKAEERLYIQKISHSVGKLTTVIENILELSKLENAKRPPILQKVNVSESISESVLLYDGILDEKNLTVNIQLDSSLIVNADAALLSTVWNNLLSNAVKFTPEGGRIDIVLNKNNEWAEVMLKDNGCGMDEHTLRHLFEKFFQADSSRGTNGNGLGLAMVKRIMEILDGEIEVESELGSGSLFTVRLKILS